MLAILKESCFDCHSNETEWPLYARIAPGSWLMARDVRKGRSRLNMSEWGETDEEERTLDRESSWDEIQEGEMPPWFYLPMHPSARLDDKEKAILKEWLLKKRPAEPAVAVPAEGTTDSPPVEGAAAVVGAAVAGGAASKAVAGPKAGATKKQGKARPGKQPLRRRAKAGRPSTKSKQKAAARARGNRPRPNR